jgi:hypothetical protein
MACHGFIDLRKRYHSYGRVVTLEHKQQTDATIIRFSMYLTQLDSIQKAKQIEQLQQKQHRHRSIPIPKCVVIGWLINRFGMPLTQQQYPINSAKETTTKTTSSLHIYDSGNMCGPMRHASTFFLIQPGDFVESVSHSQF